MEGRVPEENVGGVGRSHDREDVVALASCGWSAVEGDARLGYRAA